MKDITTLSVSAISALVLQMAAAPAQAFPNVPFQLNGNAVAGSFLVRLTPASTNQRGSAFVPISLGLGGAFHTSFSFQITNNCGINDGFGVGADGLVFVVQDAAAGATALGGLGGSMGYGAAPAITDSLGIEFDTWNNGAGDGNNSNHVGVNTNGSLSGLPRANIATLFNNGAVHTAKVDYDGTNLNITVDSVLVGSKSPP